ncbi:MAG TPA: SiaC family regulatory phosphoprotein [Anaeromyxobacteraceae bacterium]|nr:SiaC family regulatory phosphoprotein [Anaeromyxobacteraceae bacterium]
MDPIVLGDLTATFDRNAPNQLHVRLAGKSASRDAGKVLAPLFDQTLAVASTENRVIVLHFEKLEYFNSSTIAALVQFIRSAQEKKLGLTVVYDAALKWQAMSFDALRRAMKPFQTPGGSPGVIFSTAVES